LSLIIEIEGGGRQGKLTSKKGEKKRGKKEKLQEAESILLKLADPGLGERKGGKGGLVVRGLFKYCFLGPVGGRGKGRSNSTGS